MSKRHKRNLPAGPSRSQSSGKIWAAIVVIVMAGAAAAVWVAGRGKETTSLNALSTNAPKAAASTEMATNEVAQAIMVTKELDFGGKPPSIKDALKEIERRHEPDDRTGRTFSMLDAYGEPTPDG